MNCTTCHGHGRVTYDEHPEPKPEPFGSVFPCPTCAGTGTRDEDAEARLSVEGIEQLARARTTRFPTAKLMQESTPAEKEIPGVREMFEGRMRDVVDASRSGWWRFNQHYDRNGYCDNPARGY